MCTCYSQNFKILASFCSWADWFESYLVENLRRHIFPWYGSYGILIYFNKTLRSRRVQTQTDRDRIVGQDQLLLVCDNASPTYVAFFDIRYCVGRNPVRQLIEVPRYQTSFWAWKWFLSVFSDTRCYNGCETDGTQLNNSRLICYHRHQVANKTFMCHLSAHDMHYPVYLFSIKVSIIIIKNNNNNRNNNYYCYYYYYNFISRGKLTWHECQSNIWSSDTKTYMRLIIKMKIIYNMYKAGEVSIHRACCERATQPYSLGGGRYDLSKLKTSRCYHT